MEPDDNESDRAIEEILRCKSDEGQKDALADEFEKILRNQEALIVEGVRKGATTYKNFFGLVGASNLASANKISRLASTHLGKAWEEMAALSHLAISPERSLKRRIVGVDIVLLERNTLRHTQLKTQKNTLTGAQASRSVAELSKHPHPLFAAAFDVSNWTFPPFKTSKIERVAGRQFWEEKLEISFDLVLRQACESARRLENALFN